MQDGEKKDKKLTLTVRNVETLEMRSSPHTACPDQENYAGQCCRGTANAMYASKLTAVAYF